MARAPKVNTLARHLRIAEVSAEQIRDTILRANVNDPRAVDRALDRVNAILKGFGVEAIEADKVHDPYYQHIALLYVNLGETYQPTIYFNTITSTFNVGSWGDWVEANDRRYRIR